jgi:putative acetyltransferase
MIIISRTQSTNKDFIELVKLLDADLKIRDGEDHAFYNQFNKVDTIKHVVVAYKNEQAIACGAIKEYDQYTMEIKRMFTHVDFRSQGIASMIIIALEKWAKELTYERIILETGIKQPEAINLYKKNGYVLIPNYGQYTEIETSVCFEKNI